MVASFARAITLLALHESESQLAQAIGRDRKGKLSLLAYVIAFACAFVVPWVSVGALVAVCRRLVRPRPPRHPHARGRLIGRIILNFRRSGCSLEATREEVEQMAGPISKRARRSVLAHVDANLEALAATRSTSGSSRRGCTTHFTTYYSNGLLIHEPGDVIQLTCTNGWQTS
jgi:hypothetical protein